MADPDFQYAIDTIWPDIKKARNTAWMIVIGVLGLSVGLGFGAQAIGLTGIFIFIAGFILTGFTMIWEARSVALATRPLAAKVLGVSGLTETKTSIDMAPLHASGFLPTTEKSRLDDRAFVKFGSYRADRAELNLHDITRFKNRDIEVPYFAGYALILTGLPAQTPMTLLREVDKRGFKRLRAFMSDQDDPALANALTITDDVLGPLTIFGDDIGNENDGPSAAAQHNIATFAQIHQLTDPNSEHCFSAHFGPDYCAVAITANRSRLTIGGMWTTKAKVANNVAAALTRLGRSLTIAEAIIIHATSARDQSS